jgi:hypothetical protein
LFLLLVFGECVIGVLFPPRSSGRAPTPDNFLGDGHSPSEKPNSVSIEMRPLGSSSALPLSSSSGRLQSPTSHKMSRMGGVPTPFAASASSPVRYSHPQQEYMQQQQQQPQFLPAPPGSYGAGFPPAGAPQQAQAPYYPAANTARR